MSSCLIAGKHRRPDGPHRRQDGFAARLQKDVSQLARKYHPDLSKLNDAEHRFKELGEAYGVLKDTEKRAAYDRVGDQWRDGQDFQPPPHWNEGFEDRGVDDSAADNGHFSEIFESFFRGERADGDPASTRRTRRTTGGIHDHATAQAMEDAHRGVPYSASGHGHYAKVVIDLEDTYRGARRTISLETPVPDASGRAAVKSRTLDVSIPKGVRGGQHLRLAGQGGVGFGDGAAGDLYLEIVLRKYGLFSVDGRDVTIVVPVAPWEAALGARIKVPTPGGAVEIAVPKGSRAGRRLRLRGKGIPASGAAGTAGDLYAQLNIVLPPADSEEARAAYEALRRACDFDPRVHFLGEAA